MTYFCEVCRVERVFWRINGDIHYQTIGIPNVLIKNICTWKCSACATLVEAVQGANRIINVVALAIIKKPYRLKIREVLFMCRVFNLQTQHVPCLHNLDAVGLDNDLSIPDDQNVRSVLFFRVREVRQSCKAGEQGKLLEDVRCVEPQGFHYIVDATNLTVEYIGTH